MLTPDSSRTGVAPAGWSWLRRGLPTGASEMPGLCVEPVLVEVWLTVSTLLESSTSWCGALPVLLEPVADEHGDRVHEQQDHQEQHDRGGGELLELRLRLLDQVVDLDRERGVRAEQAVRVEP